MLWMLGMWAGLALASVVGWFFFGPHAMYGIFFFVALLNVAAWAFTLRSERLQRQRDDPQ